MCGILYLYRAARAGLHLPQAPLASQILRQCICLELLRHSKNGTLGGFPKLTHLS